jgi:hypothetical protein
MGDDRKRIVGNNIRELGQVSTTNAASRDLRPSQWNLESFEMGKENYTDDSCGYLKAGHTQTPESQQRVQNM